jgi:hypothetical protein
VNKFKFSVIGHRNLSICNPISSEKLNRAIALLSLKPSDRIVDFGAGEGEILVCALERYGSFGAAVELQEGLISDLTRILHQNIRRSNSNRATSLGSQRCEVFCERGSQRTI